MGNSQTKEARASLGPSQRRSNHPSGSGRSPYGDRHHSDGSRSGRSSRPDISLLGIVPSAERDVATLEHRRETRQEREARRLERERTARIKERERSMREEHVDGGYLVTQGVYVGTEDFNKAVVRQLMIERRLAPFWRGLNDHSDSWTEHQLVAAARGIPIPPPDEIPPGLEYKNPPKATTEDAKEKEPSSDSNTQNLMVPITSRSPSHNSEGSQASSTPAHSLPSPTSPIASGGFSSPFRSRAKTLASLTTSTKPGAQAELTPREFQLTPDPLVNGQPIEAYLYKDAGECPICFLYYPPYLNRTRCCDQPICSECFVQIKRPEPHPPEHGDPDPNAPNPTPASEGDRAESADTQLVAEPAACPFCVQPEFGVTYVPPSFRRGLSYTPDLNARANLASPMSSSTSSLSSGNPPAVTGRRRATSLSANDPTVVTTDKIRPDWAQKLANARAHAARRSAAATALHTAAYLANSNGNESRNFSLGRRRRASAAPESQGRAVHGSPALHALAFLTNQRAPPPTQETEPREEGTPAPPRGSSRRSRLDDLEEMMMMEAIRLSLASEEDRRKKEEKEIKKESKRREKEAKKVEKTVRKNGLSSNEPSSSGLGAPRDGRLGAIASSSSSVIEEEEEETSAAKGKEVDRASPSMPTTTTATAANAPTAVGESSSSDASSAGQPATIPSTTEPSKPSHLRHMSSASSSFSSLVEATDEHSSAYPTTAEGSQPPTEPMFNFRSLAAVIGDEDEDKGGEPAEHVEHTSTIPEAEGSANAPAAPKAAPQEVPDGGNTTSVEQTTETVPEHRECIMPKELETRSVEITGTTPNPETT